MDIRTLYNDDKMQKELKNKLNCLESTNDILEKIQEGIDSKNNSYIENNELIIRIDRRKNKESIVENIRDVIAGILKDPDSIDLLLKIIEGENEVIVRKRREKM